MTPNTKALDSAIADLTAYRDGIFDNAPSINGKISGWQYDNFHKSLVLVLDAAKAYQAALTPQWMPIETYQQAYSTNPIVLVWAPGRCVTVGKDTIATGWCIFGAYGKRLYDYTPTHWQPLPAAPSKEGE